MDEAERCSRVGLIYKGRLMVDDTPENIQGMTDGDLFAIWPSNIHQARQALDSIDEVIEIQTFGDQLRVFVNDSEGLEGRLRAALDGSRVEIRDLRRTRPRMEEAFISLIRRYNQSENNGEM